MADLGRALISVIIRDRNLTTAMDAGVRSNWFEDMGERVFGWVVDYHARYGEVPGRSALKREYPTFRLLVVREPYEYYVDQFRKQRHRALLVDGMIEADEHLEGGEPNKAQGALSRALIQAGVETTQLTDANVVGNLPSRYKEYQQRRRNRGCLTGVPTGFPTLDLITGGYQRQQFIVIGGQPKQAKSFLMMRMAIASQHAKCKALYLSFEMSASEQLCRYDAITCGLNANDLIRGSLANEDMAKLRDGYKKMHNWHPLVVSTDISASTTISGLAGKIEQHQPDIVFVDGMYLMDNETGADKDSTQHFMSISRGLKRLAQRSKLPIVGTTQALSSKMSKGVVTMHSLGWTSAWSQDADLILGVEKIEDRQGVPLVCLRVVAGRNVAAREINVSTDWESSSIEEIQILVQDDDDDDDDDTP